MQLMIGRPDWDFGNLGPLFLLKVKMIKRGEKNKKRSERQEERREKEKKVRRTEAGKPG